MRRLAIIAALYGLSACGSEGGQPSNKQQQQPDPPPRVSPRPPPPAPPPPEGNEAVEAPARVDPALAQMSPGRRRAYERGLADCRAGRYDPDPWPEAYRIGCAAAHDR